MWTGSQMLPPPDGIGPCGQIRSPHAVSRPQGPLEGPAALLSLEVLHLCMNFTCYTSACWRVEACHESQNTCACSRLTAVAKTPRDSARPEP